MEISDYATISKIKEKTKPSETPVVPMSKVQDVFVSFVLYG